VPRGSRRGRVLSRGARSNDKNSHAGRDKSDIAGAARVLGDEEPHDHAIGRSRGGLTTKTHALVDGRGRALVIAVSPGQAGDNPALAPMLTALRVPRQGSGRPRTRPDRLRADKAYSARATRALLRSKGVVAVIPQRSDEIANRARRGSRGGRPVAYDVEDYRNRNVVERGFNVMKNWRGLATRYDKHALVYRGGIVLAAILTWLR
jgi:transposase